MNALEIKRQRLHDSIKRSKNLLSKVVLKQSMELDKLIVEAMKPKGGLFRMISDCKECVNKGTELCQSCAETSGRPSNFMPMSEDATNEH